MPGYILPPVAAQEQSPATAKLEWGKGVVDMALRALSSAGHGGSGARFTAYAGTAPAHGRADAAAGSDAAATDHGADTAFINPDSAIPAPDDAIAAAARRATAQQRLAALLAGTAGGDGGGAGGRTGDGVITPSPDATAPTTGASDGDAALADTASTNPAGALNAFLGELRSQQAGGIYQPFRGPPSGGAGLIVNSFA